MNPAGWTESLKLITSFMCSILEVWLEKRLRKNNPYGKKVAVCFWRFFSVSYVPIDGHRLPLTSFDRLQKDKGRLKNEELLSNLVFEACGSCNDLAAFGGFNFVFERDDFGQAIKAA